MEDSPIDQLLKLLEGSPTHDPVVRKIIRGLSQALGQPAPDAAALRQRVRRSDLDREPHLAWNEYVTVLAHGEYEEFNPIQRVAHLAFWYDAEVQNGGHLQYFLNSAGRHAERALDALETLGAHEQRRALAAAIELVRANPLPEGHTSSIYRDSPLAKPLRELDRAYGVARPVIVTELLQRYLDEHFSEFIDVIEDSEAPPAGDRPTK
jgi:hypothetical protein